MQNLIHVHTSCSLVTIFRSESHILKAESESFGRKLLSTIFLLAKAGNLHAILRVHVHTGLLQSGSHILRSNIWKIFVCLNISTDKKFYLVSVSISVNLYILSILRVLPKERQQIRVGLCELSFHLQIKHIQTSVGR